VFWKSFQPDFPPPRIYAAGAKQSVTGKERSAVHALQYDRGSPQALHFARLFVDEFFHARLYAIDLATIGPKLRVK
jgi:hypothetical protein